MEHVGNTRLVLGAEFPGNDFVQRAREIRLLQVSWIKTRAAEHESIFGHLRKGEQGRGGVTWSSSRVRRPAKPSHAFGLPIYLVAHTAAFHPQPACVHLAETLAILIIHLWLRLHDQSLFTLFNVVDEHMREERIARENRVEFCALR